MDLYLSGLLSDKNILSQVNLGDLNVLQAFPYMKNDSHIYINQCRNFLLDSGAFTMMNKKNNKNFNIVEYTKKYAEYIKKYNVKDFIELDIDGVYGIQTYKDCLHQLQDITGKNPIKVFHTWRGLDYYKELVKKENRICIGGIAIKHIKESDYDMFLPLIKIAHDNNCKVHGLGLTGSANLRKYNFDSIDSSRYTMAGRCAQVQRFDGHSIIAKDICSSDHTFDTSVILNYDLLSWKKYSEYLIDF